MNLTMSRRWVTPGCAVPNAAQLLAVDHLTSPPPPVTAHEPPFQPSTHRQHGTHQQQQQRLSPLRLFFIGDSITNEVYEAFLCRLLHDATTSTGTAASSTTSAVLVKRGIQPPWHDRVCAGDALAKAWGHNSNRSRPAGAQPASCHCDEVRITRASDEAGGRAMTTRLVLPCMIGVHLEVAEVAAHLIASRIATRPDVILLNEGLWHNNAGLSHATLRRLITSAASGPLSRRDGVGLIWREVTPQHFETPTGHFKPWLRMGWSRHCSARVRPTRDTTRAGLLNELEAVNVPVVWVWNLSSTQNDMHIENLHTRGPNASAPAFTSDPAGNVDCSHFCAPSGVLEAFVDATLLELQANMRSMATADASRYSSVANRAEGEWIPVTHPDETWALPNASSTAVLGLCTMLTPVRSCALHSNSRGQCLNSRAGKVACAFRELATQSGAIKLASCYQPTKLPTSLWCPAAVGVHFF